MRKILIFLMKELFKHGIVYGITSSLQNVLSFILLPLLTTYYTPSEFGVYSIILLSGTLANAIFYFGAGSALGRFYFEVDTDTYRRQIISSSLLITFFGALILISFSFIFKAQLSTILFNRRDFEFHLFYAFVGTAFGFMLNILTLVLRYENRSMSYMVVTISGVILNFVVTYVLLVKFKLGILAPILGTMLSNTTIFIFLFFHIFNFVVGEIQVESIKRLLNFGLQSSITGICFFLLDWVDRLIIKELLPMSDVGIYSLAYRLGSMINVFLIMPFGLIWAPLRLQNFKSNSDNNIFVTKVASYFFLIGIFFVLVATIYNDIFIDLFFKNKEYFGVSKIFPIVMLAILIYGLQSILDFGIYYHKKIYYYIIISIVGILINISLNFYFVPIYGYVSAAYITLITYLFTTSLIFISSNKYHVIKLEWGRILFLFVFISLIYFLTCYTSIFHNWGELKRLVLLIFSIWLGCRFWLDSQERSQIFQYFKKKVNSEI